MSFLFGHKAPSPPPMPKFEKPEDIEKKTKKKVRRGLKPQTILTSPLGLTESAPIQRPTLLGG